MATLQILCPNGRRQNVKITPNTKLLQVLEDVCQKQKFLPAEDYQLVQGRKTLDLTLSVRFSNLPNNAKLELVKAERSRAESDVMIALQLEGGERLQRAFHPGTSLWELLQHWEQQADSGSEVKYQDRLTRVDCSVSPALHPVCIYMREEVTGEYALQETKLRNLGLTGGKAVIRLLHRAVEDSTLEEIHTKIDREKLRKARLEGSQKPAGTSSSSSSSSSSSATSKTKPDQSVQRSISIEAQVKPNESSGSQTTEIKTENTTISLNINLNIQNPDNGQTKQVSAETDESATGETRVQNEACDVQSEAQRRANDRKGEEPAPKIGRMEESHDHLEPMEVEHCDVAMETEEAVSSSTEQTQADVPPPEPEPVTPSPSDDGQNARNSAVEHLRNIPGLQVFTPDDFNDLPTDQQQLARRLASSFLANMAAQGQIPGGRVQPQAGTRQRSPQAQAAPFAEFKFPEETKGKQLYQNEMSSVDKTDFQPCDRRAMVFNVEESLRPTGEREDQELPDEFFELTERDIRSLVSEKQKRLSELEDQPLMTSAMRRAKLEEEYSLYDRVVIRVHFHDKLVLQGVFRPRETLFAVQKFVKDHLEDKSLQFYLYTAPPKNVLKDKSQTLIEARLVPASVIYFGCDQQKDHYLSEAVLKEQTAKLTADMLVAECLEAVNKDQSPGTDGPSYTGKGKNPASSSSPQSSSSPSSSKPSTSAGSSKPVPKWFKVGKK